LVITKIELTSPLNYLQVNDIIVEVQKKKITSIKILNDIVNDVLQSDESNLLIVVYNNQNQRRYLGAKIK
jgi:serine protease Do